MMSTDKQDEPAALRVGKGEAFTVGTYAVFGAVGAAVCGVVSVYMSQNSSTTPLRPETGSLHHIPNLRSLLVELQDFRHLSPSHFAKAVTEADNYAFIYGQVVAGKSKATEERLDTMYRMKTLVEYHIDKISYKGARNKRISNGTVSDVTSINMFIYEELKDSFQVVVKQQNL